MQNTIHQFTDYVLPAPTGAEISTIPETVEVPKNEAKELIIKQKLLNNFIQTQNLIKTQIQFSEPLLVYSDLPILYPGSLTTLQGRKGSNKSRITELFISSLIANLDRVQTEFQRKADEEFFCIYFDTERNAKEQFPASMQNIIRTAGYNFDNEYKPHFAFYSLIEFSRNDYERFEAMKFAVEKHRAENPSKRIVIVVDVVTDLIGSFNDIGESMKVLDYLNLLCNQQDISVIAIIHENKNDANSRGHLGSETTNKSSVVCRVETERKSRIVKLHLLHTRGHKEPDEPFYFEFDETTKLLKSVDKQFVKDTIIAENELMRVILKILQPVDKLNRADLIRAVQSEINRSEQTIDRELNNLCELNTLFREKIGRSVWYGITFKPIVADDTDNEAPLF